ncbi:MAG: aspartate/glutamate racemase family protein [Clostridiales bacterium]|nr:aspartate/glutamate racemase family protein [Clostridiales bacterium]
MLGIIGGLGPMSTVYFYELLTSMTLAETDQDHIDIVISSRASTPDRTAFILGESDKNPLDYMIEDAHRLIRYGADILAIPCNTAHYFYDQLAESVDVPLLNIIYETVAFLKKEGVERAGILATSGTIQSHTYQLMCDRFGIEYKIPSDKNQQRLSNIIYGSVKRGKPTDPIAFAEIANELKNAGCDRIILGCTELSLIKRQVHLDDFFADSLDILARSAIRACGKKIRS